MRLHFIFGDILSLQWALISFQYFSILERVGLLQVKSPKTRHMICTPRYHSRRHSLWHTTATYVVVCWRAHHISTPTTPGKKEGEFQYILRIVFCILDIPAYLVLVIENFPLIFISLCESIPLHIIQILTLIQNKCLH